MAPSHLLDTSVYSQVLKPRPLPSVVRRWRLLGDDRLAISSICEAELLYGLFVEILRHTGLNVGAGVFGAMMEIELTNSGPVTLMIDSPSERECR